MRHFKLESPEPTPLNPESPNPATLRKTQDETALYSPYQPPIFNYHMEPKPKSAKQSWPPEISAARPGGNHSWVCGPPFGDVFILGALSSEGRLVRFPSEQVRFSVGD